jgi:type II secretory pathway pseudopilin PulG
MHPTSSQPSPKPARTAGFTLVELLVVVSILMLLASMAMPMLNIIRNESLKSRTTFIVSKVDGSLRLFKTDWGVYPYQQSYPDLTTSGQVPQPASNHLAYRLGRPLADVDRVAMTANMAAAQSAFGYNFLPGGAWTEGVQPAPNINYTANDLGLVNHDVGDPNYQPIRVCTAVVLNRMGGERAADAMLAGDTDLRGPIESDATGAMVANRANVAIIPAASLAAGTPGLDPGMANDYLLGSLDRHCIVGDTIVDAWHHPLVYVCQAIPGIRNAPNWVGGNGYSLITSQNPEGCFDPKNYGLGPIGFDPTTGPVASVTAANRTTLLYDGRIRLSRTDAGDGQATPVDVSYFPTANQLMTSDVRYYAAPGFETEFELWSAGRDGRFSYQRDDKANADNLAAQGYNKPLANE